MLGDDSIFRWTVLAVITAGIGTSAYFRLKARQDGDVVSRREETPTVILLRLFGALPLFGSVVAYIANPDWMRWSSLDLPVWTRWIGVGLGALAVWSVRWVLQSLGRNVTATVLTKRTHELVSHGPYRWVRHPLYTTGVLLFASVGLMAANWFILSFAVLAMALIRIVVIPREEAELEAKFGEAYRAYRDRTGRFLPRL